MVEGERTRSTPAYTLYAAPWSLWKEQNKLSLLELRSFISFAVTYISNGRQNVVYFLDQITLLCAPMLRAYNTPKRLRFSTNLIFEKHFVIKQLQLLDTCNFNFPIYQPS